MHCSTIFNYSNPRQFMLDRLTERQRQEPGFSIRSWAREMDLKSHALLVMLLKGTRPLRVKHASFLAKGLKLTSQERLYFQALIQFDSAETPEEKELCSHWLNDINPGNDFRTKEVDQFTVISHWVHSFILAMGDTKSGIRDAADVYRRVKGKGVTLNEIRAAIERLLAMKLLKKHLDGRLKATAERVTTKDDVANIGARKYHRGVMKLADEALDSVPLLEREFQSGSIAVAAEKIPFAKEMIRKFRNQFEKALAAEPGDEVCQLNIQFFRLTESPSEIVPKEDEGADGESPNTKQEYPDYE
jgi:uncharacterized protein (TIGR02147 family)